MKRARMLGCAVAALALLAGGCGDDDDGGGGAAATTLDVTAVDNDFQGLPAEIESGPVEVTMTNEGEATHEIAFVEIGDTDIDTFFEDFGPVIEGGAPWPDYVGTAVGANEADPGDAITLTYTLPAGTYAVFCALTGTPDDPEGDGPPHFTEGMQQIVTVTGDDDGGELPEADGSITASDYTYDADISAGDTTINFTNDGPNDHMAVIVQFPEGTSVEDAEATAAGAIQSEDGEPPEGSVQPSNEDFGFSGIASEGDGVQFSVDGGFTPGTYVFFCFLSDRAGGPPHAIGNQMIKAFVVE